MDDHTHPLPPGALSAASLRSFFIDHLNRIYCAKSHLQERLPELRAQAQFSDLSQSISETLVGVEKQVSRMDQIFLLLKIKHTFENCQGLIGMIENTFTAIQQERKEAALPDLSILFYLQQIETVEMASFKMLNLTAPLMNNEKLRQLLKENFDEASEDLTLLQHISSKYFKN